MEGEKHCYVWRVGDVQWEYIVQKGKETKICIYSEEQLQGHEIHGLQG